MKLPPPVNPALIKHAEERGKSIQNRISDKITAFAGSMNFVYLHVIWFGCWIGFGVEKYPFGLLTMIVSLEAIFVSTFVTISQNRAGGRSRPRERGTPWFPRTAPVRRTLRPTNGPALPSSRATSTFAYMRGEGVR